MPGDKSVSHRALIFSALAEGTSTISGLSNGLDVQSTRACLNKLGFRIEKGERVDVLGGRARFSAHNVRLDCGNSGTTIRLLSGLIASLGGNASLSGDQSLNSRPMLRIAEPLRLMGAQINLHQGAFCPIEINQSSTLKGIHYDLPIASAQVKSALILAALFADGTTSLGGKLASRDHTERLLAHCGVKFNLNDHRIELIGGQKILARDIEVPGDPSSAAFFAAAAAVLPGSRVDFENLMLNQTRLGFFQCLQNMGASFSFQVESESPEPTGRASIQSGPLSAIEVHSDEIATLIDEVPLLAVIATQAEGTTIIRGIEELKVKESDRISATVTNLKRMGAQIAYSEGALFINGPTQLVGAKIDTYGDHRIAMGFTIAGLCAKGPSTILGSGCIDVSYPSFYSDLKQLI